MPSLVAAKTMKERSRGREALRGAAAEENGGPKKVGNEASPPWLDSETDWDNEAFDCRRAGGSKRAEKRLISEVVRMRL